MFDGEDSSNLNSPTHSQQTLLDGIPLGLGQAAALGQAVHSVQQRVNERGVRLCARKQWGTLSKQGQHSCAQVAVQG